MSWMNLLKREIDSTYKVTEGLFDMVDEASLGWKPATGSNWMTTGQLVKHLTEACGSAFRGIVTGDWGLPPGMDMNNLTPEQMLPPAEKLPTVKSMAEAKKMLQEDKRIALETLSLCDETKLLNTKAPVPWDPTEMLLGHRLLQMIDHLKQHKGQLFYYLKLQGKPVNTGHLWGA